MNTTTTTKAATNFKSKAKKEKEVLLTGGDVFKYLDERKTADTFPICLNIRGRKGGAYMEINEKMFNDIKNRSMYTSLFVESFICHHGKIHLDLTDSKYAMVNIPNLGQFTEDVKHAIEKRKNLEEIEKEAVLDAVLSARMDQMHVA